MLVLGKASAEDYSSSMAKRTDHMGDDTQAALGRLTDREKDCLRRRLHHQTAKEMAIDMGLSPHAIEKRLKMARTKLGVSSSIHAARLLAASERYQVAGPQTSDVVEIVTPAKAPNRRIIAIGAALMSITIFAIISVTLITGGLSTETLAIPKPGEIVVSGPSTFDELDMDKSGFLEGRETPVLTLVGGNATYDRLSDGSVSFSGDYVTITDGEALRDRFYAEADIDRDGKISPAEFKIWAEPADSTG